MGKIIMIVVNNKDQELKRLFYDFLINIRSVNGIAWKTIVRKQQQKRKENNEKNKTIRV
jgi:hypothetical protein